MYCCYRKCTVVKSVRDPTCVSFADNGTAVVTSYEYHCLHILGDNEETLKTIGQHGPDKLQFKGPKHSLVHNDCIYILESIGNRIQILTLDGEFKSFFGLDRNRVIRSSYSAFCIGTNERIYVCTSSQSIAIFNMDGVLMHHIKTKLTRALTGIAIDRDGNLHVSSHSGITVYTPDGDHLRDYSNQWATGITIIPTGLCLVSSKGLLAVYTSDGRLICQYMGQFYPHYVAMASDGSVWIACTDGIIVLSTLFLPPFTLSLLCHRTILLHLNQLPVSLLPPFFSKIFEEWHHELTVKMNQDEETISSACIRLKPAMPLTVAHLFVCSNLKVLPSCRWYKNSMKRNNRLCLRDGTLDEHWTDVIIEL